MLITFTRLEPIAKPIGAERTIQLMRINVEDIPMYTMDWCGDASLFDRNTIQPRPEPTDWQHMYIRIKASAHPGGKKPLTSIRGYMINGRSLRTDTDAMMARGVILHTGIVG